MMVDNEKKLCHSNSRIFILDTTLNSISSRKVNIKQVLAEKKNLIFDIVRLSCLREYISPDLIEILKA